MKRGWLSRFLARKALVPPPGESIRPVGDAIEVTYQVSYNTTRPTHQPVFRSFRILASFYEQRRHIMEASPKVTNHDLLSLYLFTRVVDEIPKTTISVAEFGTWRGSFIENLAIHASATGKKLMVHAFDTFDGFPDSAGPLDLRSMTGDEYKRRIGECRAASVEELRQRLGRYAAVTNVSMVAGDITRMAATPTRFDLVHFDMDTYPAFVAAMQWVDLAAGTRLLVDDYYQPSWTGMVDAVNEFCQTQSLYPVNLSDYFRIERSLRTQWIVLLLPLQKGR